MTWHAFRADVADFLNDVIMQPKYVHIILGAIHSWNFVCRQSTVDTSLTSDTDAMLCLRITVLASLACGAVASNLPIAGYEPQTSVTDHVSITGPCA